MNAESADRTTEDAPAAEAAEEQESLPARRGDNLPAGTRMRMTLEAADVAAEELLEAARADARAHVEEAERVAIELTEEIHRQAETLLKQASELTQQADELGSATRELTAQFRARVTLEAEEVTEEPAEALPEHAGELEPEPVEEAEPQGATATEPEAAAAESEPETSEAAEAEPDAEERYGDEADAAAEVEAEDEEWESQPPPSAIDDEEEEEEPEEEPKPRRGFFARFRRRRPDDTVEETIARQRRLLEEEEYPAAQTAASRISDETPAVAQLIARHLLESGLDEEEVERRLQEELRIEDPRAVIESVTWTRPGWNDEESREDQ